MLIRKFAELCQGFAVITVANLIRFFSVYFSNNYNRLYNRYTENCLEKNIENLMLQYDEDKNYFCSKTRPQKGHSLRTFGMALSDKSGRRSG